MYLRGRFPVVKCMACCDLFLVGDVALMYNAMEQQGLLSELHGEDGRDGLEVDEACQQDAQRWDLRYDICDFERNQCWLSSSNDAVALSVLWPSMAIVIVIGRRSLGSAVTVRTETENVRWLF